MQFCGKPVALRHQPPMTAAHVDMRHRIIGPFRHSGRLMLDRAPEIGDEPGPIANDFEARRFWRSQENSGGPAKRLNVLLW